MKTIYKKLFEIKKYGIKLQRDTKAFNYKYATLDQIQSKLNPAFQEQGLIVIHRIENNKVITDIVDKDTGEKLTSEIELTTNKPQDKGSEITYYRRYNILALLDLEVEDDDGKKAQKERKQISKPEKTDKEVDKERIADGINKIIKLNGQSKEEYKKYLKEVLGDDVKNTKEVLKLLKSEYLLLIKK